MTGSGQLSPETPPPPGEPNTSSVTETPVFRTTSVLGGRAAAAPRGASLPGQDGIVNAPGPLAVDVPEAGGSQQSLVLGGRPLLALGLQQHVQ